MYVSEERHFQLDGRLEMEDLPKKVVLPLGKWL
jgi:hypothetical protein